MEGTEPPVSTGASQPHVPSVTQGFLFADLRDYTGIVERRGAIEASRLLERYRAITREVVGRSGGAEIKTEGDSFYVVLDSASAAVRCGLALAAACAEPPDGGEPVPVGVGIHAGESVSLDGGFVGSAVNIAARVCGEARPGDVLTTATVRELTRSVVDARFVSVGRRSLKGISDPVELFRVTAGTAGDPLSAGMRPRLRTRRSRGPLTALLTVGLLVLAGLLIVAHPWAAGGSAPPSGASASASSATGSSPGPSSSVTATVASPTAASFPSVAETAIIARLPPGFASNCRRAGSPDPAASAHLVCPAPAGLPIGEVRVLWFQERPVTAAARVSKLAEDHGLADGDCADGIEAHGVWGTGSTPVGAVACFIDSANATYVYWTIDREGILAEATYFRRRLPEVEAWWASNAAGFVGPPQTQTSAPSPSPS